MFFVFLRYEIMNSNDILLETLRGGYRERNPIVEPLVEAEEALNKCTAISRRNRNQRCGVTVRAGERFCYQHRKNPPFFVYKKNENQPAFRRVKKDLRTGIRSLFNTTFSQRYVLRHIKGACRRHQIPITTSIPLARVSPFERETNPFVCFLKTTYRGKTVPFVVTNKFLEQEEKTFSLTIFLPFFCTPPANPGEHVDPAQYVELTRNVLDFMATLCARQDLGQIFNCQAGNLRTAQVDPRMEIKKMFCKVYTMNYFGFISESRHNAYLLALTKSLAKINLRRNPNPQPAKYARLAYIDENLVKRKLRNLDFLVFKPHFDDDTSPLVPGAISFDFTLNYKDYEPFPPIIFVPNIVNSINIGLSNARWPNLQRDNRWVFPDIEVPNENILPEDEPVANQYTAIDQLYADPNPPIDPEIEEQFANNFLATVNINQVQDDQGLINVDYANGYDPQDAVLQNFLQNDNENEMEQLIDQATLEDVNNFVDQLQDMFTPRPTPEE